jgi:hypothetical protein
VKWNVESSGTYKGHLIRQYQLYEGRLWHRAGEGEESEQESGKEEEEESEAEGEAGVAM